MIEVPNFRQSEFREKVTKAILQMLADMPETPRNIFVWNHYHSYETKQIAEVLRTGLSEVEATLDALNSLLHQIIRNLLHGNSQFVT